MREKMENITSEKLCNKNKKLFGTDDIEHTEKK